MAFIVGNEVLCDVQQGFRAKRLTETSTLDLCWKYTGGHQG